MGSNPMRSTTGPIGELAKPSPSQGEDSGFKPPWDYHPPHSSKSQGYFVAQWLSTCLISKWL